MSRKPYCKPHNAGLCSETEAVCRRIGRLLTNMDTEINSWVVEGDIVSDLGEFRAKLVRKLEAEGWTMSYDGGNRLKVREPGHKKPFPKRSV